MNTEPFLEYKNVVVKYGAIEALKNISFSVKQGTIFALIGSNGAGKTTLLKSTSGLIKVQKGEILHKGQTISNKQPEWIVKRAIAHAPEGRGIFLNLTVEENLDLGAWSAPKDADFDADLEYSYSLFPRLKERRKQNAGTLSGGEQQMLAIARALMSRPEGVLLDEPSLGLAPQIIEKIFEILVSIHKSGKTVVIVEQNARLALQVAHEAVVLETGHIRIAGSAKDLLNSDEVRKAYLG